MDVRIARWKMQAPTATLSDRKGNHDSYSVSLSTRNGASETEILNLAVESIMRYDIYPPHRMRSLVCSEDGKVVDGALIIQRIFFGPIAIEAAVRVVEMLYSREAAQGCGYSYVTLAGHAERGVATFKVDRDTSGNLTFNIESWSRPGDFIGAMLAPLSRILQKAFSREALDYFSISATKVHGKSKR